MNTTIDGQSVQDILLDKHPPRQLPIPSATGYSPDYHLVLFDAITPDLINLTVLKSGGSPGPLGLDTAVWKRLCTSFIDGSVLCTIIFSYTTLHILR